GVVYSFTTDRPGGFLAGEIHLLRSTLPGLSLAMKAHAGYDIASGLLRTYLGNDAGSRVHSGAVERGTVDSLLSVLWYADLRGFTRISDVSSGAEIVHMLNDVFEILTAALRPRGGHVLKFIGDAMLATQTRTGGIPASGSSRERFARGGISVGNLDWRQWMAFQEFVEARPADDALAISPRQPLLPYPHHLMGEPSRLSSRPSKR